MELRAQRFSPWLIPIAILLFGIGFSVTLNLLPQVFATDDSEYISTDGPFFATIYDNGTKTIVKTSAATVRELLDRMEITYSAYDVIEPSLDSAINADNFFINILRARPVLLSADGMTTYVMTAHHDPRTIFETAGITIYDGDEISLTASSNLLEVGLSESYSVQRNGGHTITATEEIPFTEQTIKDYSIPVGSSEVRQLGATGRRTIVYEVQYVDGVEVSRQIVSEVVEKEPVARIIAVGARQEVPPEWDTCAGYAREAGVSETDLYAALTLIYHESGCRVSAKNTSSGAYGIPQALPGSKMASAGEDWETNPVTQIRWMADYVTGRYGGWQAALNFWETHRWY